MRRRSGFTILEVMIAVFVLATVMGGLLPYLGDFLARLSDARRELEGSRFALERLRELQAAAADGVLPELGRSEGRVEEPYDYLRFELVVERSAVPLPDDFLEGPPPSSVFIDASVAEIPRFFAGQPEQSLSSLFRVSMRVFPDSLDDPQSVPPYVVYLVEPPDEAKLEGLELSLEEGAEE